MTSKKDYQNILEGIVAQFGGEISQEERHFGPAAGLPRWYKGIEGGMLMFDFADYGMFRLEITLPPPHLLKIIPHSFFTKLLGCSWKTGIPEFDKSYCIQNVSKENAARTLNSETLNKLTPFLPFMLFELSAHEYRLHKMLSIKDGYGAHDAISDIEQFSLLVQYIQRDIWGLSPIKGIM